MSAHHSDDLAEHQREGPVLRIGPPLLAPDVIELACIGLSVPIIVALFCLNYRTIYK